jgi:hypothetical protein
LSTEVVVGIFAIGAVVAVALGIVFLCVLIVNMTGRSRINVDLAGWGGAFIAAALAAALSVGLYGYSFKTSDYQAAQLNAWLSRKPTRMTPSSTPPRNSRRGSPASRPVPCAAARRWSS